MYARRRQQPSNFLILLLGMVSVLGCYLLWTGALSWLASAGDPAVEASREAQLAAQREATQSRILTRLPYIARPSNTPVPTCQIFYVNAEQGTIRECPAFSCERRETRAYEEQVCVYRRMTASADYPLGNEWYEIDLNADGAFRDLAYMHHSVLRALNPTARPSRTFTPLPTVTLTPSPSRTPTSDQIVPSPTLTPVPTITPTAARPSF